MIRLGLGRKTRKSDILEILIYYYIRINNMVVKILISIFFKIGLNETKLSFINEKYDIETCNNNLKFTDFCYI